jgi:hypothetical protein
MDRQGLPDISKSEQRVLNNSFDEKYKVLVTELVAENFAGDAINRLKSGPNGGLLNEKVPQAKKITVSGSITYIAVASPGTAQSSALWQVQKIDESVAGTTIITWADGNANYDNIATDLTALTYA